MKKIITMGLAVSAIAGMQLTTSCMSKEKIANKPAEQQIKTEAKVFPGENELGVVDHGVCAPISFSRGAVACTLADGTKQLLIYPMDHRGGYELLAINIADGSTIEVPIPFNNGGDSPFASILSKANKYYTHFGEHFVEYDPELKKFTACHQTLPTMSMMMTEAPDGTIWSASYPNCDLVSYDPKTKKFTDYGNLNNENWRQYPRYLEVGNDGWVYIGIGNTHGQIVAFNPKTKQTIPLFSDDERPNPSDGAVKRSVDGTVFGRVKEDKWYSLINGKRTELAERPQADTSCIKGSQEMFYKNFADGTTLGTLKMDEGTLEVKDPDGTTRIVNFKYTSDGCGTMSLAKLNDNKLYGATWFPMRFFRYDPATEEMNNWEAQIQYNTVYPKDNYLYIGAYSGGFTLRFDCNKPWTGVPDYKEPHRDRNPEYYSRHARECNRPHKILVTPDGKTIVMGGTPSYGSTGGGMIITDAESGDETVISHENIAENESIHSMYAFDDNRSLLIGTTTMAGTGGEVKATETSIIMFDIVDKKVLWSIKPFPGSTAITDFYKMDNGNILGVVNYKTLFILNPNTKEIVAKTDIPETYGLACSDQGPRLFFKYGDYVLMTMSKAIIKIDVSNNKPEIVSAAMTGGTGNGGAILDGRFYFILGSHLKSLNLNKPELFKPAK